MREARFRTGKVNRRVVRLFYLLSPVVFGAISLAVFKARGTSFADAFRAPATPLNQVSFGLLVGTTLGLAMGLVVARYRRLSSLRGIIRQVFVAANPTTLDLILTSVSAGFSEELLFRGALQPWLGIWITSVLFAVMHGGGIKLSKGNLLFGLFVFSTSVVLGFICVRVGLVAGMVTHATLDLSALLLYRLLLARPTADSSI